MRTVINAYTLSECMETLCEYVSAYEQQGEENLIFCEDRLTLIAERSITKALGGTFKTNVSTFSRYAPMSPASPATRIGSSRITADLGIPLRLAWGKTHCRWSSLTKSIRTM